MARLSCSGVSWDEKAWGWVSEPSHRSSRSQRGPPCTTTINLIGPESPFSQWVFLAQNFSVFLFSNILTSTAAKADLGDSFSSTLLNLLRDGVCTSECDPISMKH